MDAKKTSGQQKLYQYEAIWLRVPEATRASLLDTVKRALASLGAEESDARALYIAQQYVKRRAGTIKINHGYKSLDESLTPDFFVALPAALKSRNVAGSIRAIHAEFVDSGVSLNHTITMFSAKYGVGNSNKRIIKSIKLIASLIRKGHWPLPRCEISPPAGQEETLVMTKTSHLYFIERSLREIHTAAMLATFTQILPYTLLKHKFGHKEDRAHLLDAVLTLHWDKYKDWAAEAGIKKPEMTESDAKVAIVPLLQARDSYRPASRSLTRRRSRRTSMRDHAAKPGKPLRSIAENAAAFIRWQAEQRAKRSPKPGG